MTGVQLPSPPDDRSSADDRPTVADRSSAEPPPVTADDLTTPGRLVRLLTRRQLVVTALLVITAGSVLVLALVLARADRSAPAGSDRADGSVALDETAAQEPAAEAEQPVTEAEGPAAAADRFGTGAGRDAGQADRPAEDGVTVDRPPASFESGVAGADDAPAATPERAMPAEPADDPDAGPSAATSTEQAPPSPIIGPRTHFEVAGTSHLSIEAKAGQVLGVRGDDPAGGPFWINLFDDQWRELDRADRVPLDADGARRTVHRDDLWFRFERDGHYLLAVITDPSAVETFVAEIIDPVGELETVLTATDSYPLDGGPRTYRFDGRSGQLAIVTATQVDTALDPWIRLYDPDGALMDSDACCDPVMQDNYPDDVTNVAGRDLRLTLPLDTSGSYEVEVEAWASRWAPSDGPHALTVTVQLLDLW